MPLYCFKCECGERSTEMRTIAERGIGQVCVCGRTMSRDIGGEQGKRDMREYDDPIEMHSIGMNPDEVPAFTRANPDIEVRGGVPIAATRQQKLRALQYFGFQENN